MAARLKKTTNLTVRPLLMGALYRILLQQRDAWAAHHLARKLNQEHPGFDTCFKAIRSHLHQARDARELVEWVEAKGLSPRLETKEDFNRFLSRAPNDSFVLKGTASDELVRRVMSLDDAKLDVQEQMGRRFILCQAGIDTQKNLAQLLKLAAENPDEILVSLRLIESLTIEKSAALAFVIGQIDPAIGAKKFKSSDPAWRRQYSAQKALRTFCSPGSAPRMIEFVRSTDDALLIQGAMSALAKMTVPELFDDLAGLADRVAAASESAFIQYLALLVQSDREKAIPLLEDIRKRHPKLAPRVMTILGQARHPLELAKAVSIYQDPTETDGRLQAAVGVISELAEPKDIAALKYRHCVPAWMNERLTSVIRFKGGDESAFPFVEAYYKEFVRGKKAHNHLTCVAAFEQIGDRRALPFLREIFDSTERKRDAAHAIGNLTLVRRIKGRRYVDNPIDEHITTIGRADVSDESRAQAWKALLENKEASFQRMMEYGPIRDAISESQRGWSEEDREKFLFLSRFGDVAANQLLKASDGCSLERRYQIARLLEILLPGSLPVVRAAFEDESADSDRRLTAELALKIREQHAQSP